MERRFFSFSSSLKNLRKALSVEYIIAKHKCYMVVSYKISTDDKCISKSSRLFLNCIAEIHSKLFSTSE